MKGYSGYPKEGRLFENQRWRCRILNEFLESGLDSARVTYEKEAKTLVLGLQGRIRTRGLKDQIKARKIGDNVYLQKLK